MTKITFEHDEFEANPQFSLLEHLLERGHAIANSCRAGICQSCKVQLVAGEVNPQTQMGLPATLVDAGVFLSCCCFPTSDLSIQSVDLTSLSHKALVLEHDMLNEDVLRLRVKSEVKWQAGQVVNCIAEAGTVRSYSIASTSDQDYIELHIRIYPTGQFGQWAKHQLSVGDTFKIEQPFGECVYDSADDGKNLVLVATGTGLSPIYGVLQEAVKQRHQGSIDLYVAAGSPDRLYYQSELDALAEKMPELRVHYVVRRAAQGAIYQGMYQGNVEDLVLENHSNLRNTVMYLCGASEMINTLEKKCFFRGIKRDDMKVDRFEPAA